MLLSEISCRDISYFLCYIAASALIFDVFNHADDRDRSSCAVICGLADEPSSLNAVRVVLAFLDLCCSGFPEEGDSVDFC